MPIDFSRAWARLARTFRPSRYVLTSVPGRFSTLQPSRQCSSVSADPPGQLPMRPTGLRDPAHCCLERRVLKSNV